MKVYVYFNLHKKKFSIRALEGPNKGRVMAHRDVVHLSNVVGKVSKAGRERVLREKQKNVHAGMVGQLIEAEWPEDYNPNILWRGTVVTYNPYKYSNFVNKLTEEEWPGSQRVVMSVSNKQTVIMGFDIIS